MSWSFFSLLNVIFTRITDSIAYRKSIYIHVFSNHLSILCPEKWIFPFLHHLNALKILSATSIAVCWLFFITSNCSAFILLMALKFEIAWFYFITVMTFPKWALEAGYRGVVLCPWPFRWVSEVWSWGCQMLQKPVCRQYWSMRK